MVGQPSKVRTPLLNLTNIEDVLNSPGTNYAGPNVAWRPEWPPTTPLQFGNYPLPADMPQPPVHNPGAPTMQAPQTDLVANEATTDDNQEPLPATSEGGEVRDPLVRFWQLEEDE